MTPYDDNTGTIPFIPAPLPEPYSPELGQIISKWGNTGSLSLLANILLIAAKHFGEPITVVTDSAADHRFDYDPKTGWVFDFYTDGFGFLTAIKHGIAATAVIQHRTGARYDISRRNPCLPGQSAYEFREAPKAAHD